MAYCKIKITAKKFLKLEGQVPSKPNILYIILSF